MTNFQDFKELVKAARAKAQAEAKFHCGKGFIRSRGTFVIICVGSEVLDSYSSGVTDWKGTLTHLRQCWLDVIKDHPADKIHMSIDGGFDFAETLQGFDEGWYEPWVSDWEVEVPMELVAPCR